MSAVAVLLILAGAFLIFYGFRLKWKENKVQKDLKNLYYAQLSYGDEDLPPGHGNGQNGGVNPGRPKPPCILMSVRVVAPWRPILLSPETTWDNGTVQLRASSTSLRSSLVTKSDASALRVGFE